MTDVVITGIGQVPVGEHWEIALRSLAARAMLAAMKDSGGMEPQALYVGNFLGTMASHQANLGTLLAQNVGLSGIEAFTVEAAGASGAGAFRMGYLAVSSGYVDTALVVAVEKYTDMIGPWMESCAGMAMDYDYETMQGLTPASQAGLLMQRYIYEYGAPREAFGEFALLAHANAVGNPNAMFRKAITPETYARAEVVSAPLNRFDVAPYADGAAAAVLTMVALVALRSAPLHNGCGTGTARPSPCGRGASRSRRRSSSRYWSRGGSRGTCSTAVVSAPTSTTPRRTRSSGDGSMWRPRWPAPKASSSTAGRTCITGRCSRSHACRSRCSVTGSTAACPPPRWCSRSSSPAPPPHTSLGASVRCWAVAHRAVTPRWSPRWRAPPR